MDDRPLAIRRYETMADAEDAIILGDESGDIFDDEDALMEDLDAILMGRSVKVTKPAPDPTARRKKERPRRKRDP